MTKPNDVASHYTVDNLTTRVLAALEASHASLKDLTVTDIAGADSFHIRGRAATVELAERVGFKSDWRVLDVGSGPGGTARYLADAFGCHVTGLDLTPSFVELSEKLSELVGLTDKTAYKVGNALDMPFEDASFDAVWLEHVQMNIEDKAALLAEIARVLKPGGTLAIHEILRGDGDEVLYPAPWSEAAETSFLVTPDAFQELAQSAGFTVQDWRDVSAAAANWFQEMAANTAESGPPPLGVAININANAPEKLGNVRRNVEENRIALVQAVLRA